MFLEDAWAKEVGALRSELGEIQSIYPDFDKISARLDGIANVLDFEFRPKADRALAKAFKMVEKAEELFREITKSPKAPTRTPIKLSEPVADSKREMERISSDIAKLSVKIRNVGQATDEFENVEASDVAEMFEQASEVLRRLFVQFEKHIPENRELIGSLSEAKQVGNLYHFIDPDKFISIVKSNRMIPHGGRVPTGMPLSKELINYTVNDEERGGHVFWGVSMTRNATWKPNQESKSPYWAAIRITFNGNKLSNNNKIIPYNDFWVIGGGKSRGSFDPFFSQAEEVVLTDKNGLKNWRDYVISIDALESVKDQIKDIGIPVNFVKSFSRQNMKEDSDPKLNKPMRGDVKKYKVFVKDPDTGNIKKVNFGDPNMEIKRDDPKRRKSFRARHKCDTAKDKTTPRYWSCKFWSKKPVSELMKESLNIKPIQWSYPSEKELKDEFHEADIDQLLLPMGYPKPEEREEAFEFFKNNLKEMEIDPETLEADNAWRFRHKDYKSFRDLVKSYGGPKDPDSMVRKIQAGGELPMPVVIRKADGNLRLAGGATRVSIASLAGQKVKALVIDETKALERRIVQKKKSIENYISKSKNPDIRELNDKIMKASALLSPEELKHWDYEEDGKDLGFDAHHLSLLWEQIRGWEHKIAGEKSET